MKTKVFKTNPTKKGQLADLNFSQAKVFRFDLQKYRGSAIAQIGAGAIGTHAALALVRKGIGALDIFDDDTVELKNLTRQLFSIKDVGKNKAHCLAKILSKHGFFKTTLTAHPFRFQEALEEGLDFSRYDAIVCAVDNNPSRVLASRHCLSHDIPLITNAVSRDGNQMYCAVQEPGKACFGCIVPHAVNDDSYPCNLPGIIDIIQVVSGYTVYALDTVLMGRPRQWNINVAFLDGGAPDHCLLIPKKDDCPLCGKGAA